MPPINFNDVFNTLKQGVVNLAETSFTQFAGQAKGDGQAFLDLSKSNLKDWTAQLANGTLSKEDFTDLLLGQKDLFKLTALTEAGLAAIALDNFKTGVFNLIQQTIFSVI